MDPTGTRQGANARPSRRRSRGHAPRPHAVKLTFTEDEYTQVSEAAQRVGLACGAYAAEATIAAASSTDPPATSPLRDALVELMSAAGLVRRVGVNLNQAVAKLNATGQQPNDLAPAANICARAVRRLDDAAEQVRKRLS